MKEQEKRELEFLGPLYMFNISVSAYQYIHTTQDNIDNQLDFKVFLYGLARYVTRRHVSLYSGYGAQERQDVMKWLNDVYLAYDVKNSFHEKIPRDKNFVSQVGNLGKIPTEPLEQLTIKSLPSVQIPPEEPEKPKEKKSSNRYDYLTGEEAGIILGMNRNKVAEYCKKGLLARRYEDPHDKRGSYNRLEVIEFARKLEGKGEES